VGLLPGHTTLTAHVFKLGLTQRQDCRLRGDEKDNVRIVRHCLALTRKGYRTLDHMFLMPKDLENIMLNGLISLVPNTRLGIIPYPILK